VVAIVRTVATAHEGTRNDLLFWASCRMGEVIHSGGISMTAAVEALRTAATTCGLEDNEANRTIESGITHGQEGATQ
jgi:hypothetical protein